MNRFRNLWLIAVIVLACGLHHRSAFAQATWNGSVNGAWATQANWSGASAANLVNSGTTAIVFAGSTQVSTTNTLSNFLASSLTFDSTAGNFTLSGSAIRLGGNILNSSSNSSQTINVGISITGGRQFLAVGSATNTYTGNLSGASGGISYRTSGSGTAVHIVSGSNSYTANTAIDSGFVVVNHLKALSSGTITFGGGVTSGNFLASNLDLTGANRLTNASVGFTNPNNWGRVTGSNSIEFAAALRSNNNSFFANQLDVGKTLTFGGVVASGTITSGTVTFTGAGRTVISGNAIDGTGITLTLAKTGAGSLVLSGTNTYSGTTAVTAGSLFVNGDSSAAAGAVTVSSTAVLGGAGSIGGVTTVSGTLTPGADAAQIGLLTFTNALTLGSTSRTLLEITSGGRGTGYDALDVAGLTYGGILDLSFAGTVNGSFNLFGTGTALSKSGSFASVVSSGAYGSLTWSLAGETWTATSGADTLTFDQSTGTLAVVPEPGAVALAACGVFTAGLLARRRARVRRPA